MDEGRFLLRPKEKKEKQKKIRRKLISITVHPNAYEFAQRYNIHLAYFLDESLLEYAKSKGHKLTLNTHEPVQIKNNKIKKEDKKISKSDDYDDGFDCYDPRAWEE